MKCRVTDGGSGSEGRGRNSFSLIELLVAMCILTIIVLIMSTLFHQSSVCWDSGMRKSQGQMSARAALGFIGRKLQMAVADGEYLNFQLSGGGGSTRIQFCTLEGDSTEGAKHVARRITFQAKNDSVYYAVELPEPDNYGSWLEPQEFVLCTNVANIQFRSNDGMPYTYGSMPKYVETVLALKRSDDVSRVSAQSAGIDGEWNTDDDMEAY